MSYVKARSINFSYPVFDASARSLKLKVMRSAVGATLSRNAGVVYVDALKDVSFDLKPGDRLGLIGHNGSGKTSLLRILGGLAFPNSGTVETKGRVVPLIERGIGINQELSGHENIELPLRLLGATSQEIRHAKQEIPEWTGLGDFMDLPVRTYSAGMRARFMFAISTAIAGDILLLDEWLGAGDATFAAQSSARLSNYLENAGILVLASHAIPLIAQVCNKAAWMDHGVVRAYGDAIEVAQRYERETAAELAEKSAAAAEQTQPTEIA